ncbi:hypothetical protein M422DRAFT_254412, partial [Sphaerobolus stellatus SS14]
MTSLISVLQRSQLLGEAHVDALRSRIASVQTALSQMDTVKDQELFIDYNRSGIAFKIPDDSQFEPCEGFYDHGDVSVEPSPKVFLQNKLSRCKAKLKELGPLLGSKETESEKLQQLVQSYTEDEPSLGNLEEVKERLIDTQQQLTYLTTSQEILSAEINFISEALAGDEGGQHPHVFKSASFSIPTQCGYCKSSIWGLSKQGKTCKLCHISVHNKCELKIPADCKASASSGHIRASDSVSSISHITSHPSSITEEPTPSSFA